MQTVNLYQYIFTRKSTGNFDSTPLEAETLNKIESFISGVKPLLPESKITHKIVNFNVNTGDGVSAIWIYVIEKDKVPRNNMDWAWHAIGAMSQHQYLVAEEFDIQARYTAAVNAAEVINLLSLDAENQIPAGVMIMVQK